MRTISTCPLWTGLNSHGDVEEEGEQRLVVDGPADEAALVELGRSLSHHDAQADPPQEQAQLSCQVDNGHELRTKHRTRCLHVSRTASSFWAFVTTFAETASEYVCPRYTCPVECLTYCSAVVPNVPGTLKRVQTTRMLSCKVKPR